MINTKLWKHMAVLFMVIALAFQIFELMVITFFATGWGVTGNIALFWMWVFIFYLHLRSYRRWVDLEKRESRLRQKGLLK